MNLDNRTGDIPDLQKVQIIKHKRKQAIPKKLDLDKVKRTRKQKIKILEEVPPPITIDKLVSLDKSLDIKPDKQQKQTRKRKIKVLSKSPIVISEQPYEPVQQLEQVQRSNKRWNEEFIDILGKLATIESKKGEHFRARAYKKAQETIMSFTADITYVDQLKDQPGIGKTIYAKLQEYIDTGVLAKIEKEKDKPEYILSNVYGIGPKKAKELVEQGITSITQLRAKQDEVLNAVQKIGLQYYEDIETRIPRSEIDEYHIVFDAIYQDLQKTDPSIRYEIVGSYRRGAQNSGDIDVIITSSQPNTFKKFIDSLIENHTILEILSRGNSKCLVIAKLPGKSHARRVDFLYASPREFPFSILYFTGSKEFNTVMRGHALKMGYTMNEHGFSKMEGKQKADELIPDIFMTELDIFNFLGLKYKRPEDRIDGRSVILGQNTPDSLSRQSVALVHPLVHPLVQPVLDQLIVEQPLQKQEQKQKKVKKVNVNKTEKVKSPKNKTIKPTKNSIRAADLHSLGSMTDKDMNHSTKSYVSPKDSNINRFKNNIKIIGDTIIPKDSIAIMHEHNPTIVQETKSNPDIIKHITNFKTKGLSFLESLPESELSKMIILANNQYYNENPLLNDNEYDILKEFVERKFPRNTVIDAVGAPISGRNKVNLPFEMWSMDKIKPDSNALSQWKAKYPGPYTLSCKLDGVSGLYYKDARNKYTLYTRGNGLVGQEISHLIDPLHLPKIKSTSPYAIRGEFIIPKRVFQEKYKDKFANPRNMVAGMVNKQSHDERIQDLKFVVYEIISPKIKPSEQLNTLKIMGFDTVLFREEAVETLSNELLSGLLLDWRKNYEYEIDGVIVTDDHIHERVSSNPEHAFAFKMVISDQMAEAKVVDVLWEASKNGYLKPRVRIEPVNLGGVRIEYATGFNGKFIEENRIGVGALIQLVRSGDVIPYIQSITQPAEFPKMPEQAYHWTESHVDLILDDLDSDPKVLEKNITAFFVELEVEGLAKGNIKRLVDAGFDSVAKILQMTNADFEKVGFKTLADKFVSNISTKISKASLPLIMSASNKLGRGISGKTVETIMSEEPDILTSMESDEVKIAKLVKIKSVGKVVAKTFVEHIGEFLGFLRECGLESKLHANTVVSLASATTMTAQVQDTSHPLFGKKIVMTKVRDQEIIQKLVEVGGILADNVSSDTFVVIVKSKDDTSAKVKKALEKGIPIMTPDEFKQMYM